MVKLSHCAKFCSDRSNHHRDIAAIFWFSRWRPFAVLNCKKFRILTADKVETVKMRHHSSCQISWRSVKPLLSREMAISQFIQHGGCLPSWICCAHLDHARRVFDGLHCCAKLVGISAILSIICTFLDFASLAWKCLFTPPKLGFLGFYPEIGRHQRNLKRYIVG